MPKSMVKDPRKEAEEILRQPGMKLNITELSEKTGIGRKTLGKYVHSGFESAPFWAVCKTIKYLNIPDEDRLKLIRCYTGEKK